MKTIVLSANATPDMNLAKINIDNAGFDPHCGPSFWVTFYNPANNIIDRVTHSMTFDQWQDWTSESSEIADYKYIDIITTLNIDYNFDNIEKIFMDIKNFQLSDINDIYDLVNYKYTKFNI